MEREQVIKGMEEVVRDFKDEIEEWGHFTPDEMRGGISVDCDWYYGVMQKCEAGLEMLKRDVPRVLTLAAVRHLDYATPYIIETRERGQSSWMVYGLFSHSGVALNYDFQATERRIRLYEPDYGYKWRIWSTCPTDNQKKATPWRGE